MKTVIIGTGNVATVFARKFKNAGHILKQVFGRTPEKAASLAREVGASACSSIENLDTNADFYLFCISDDALKNFNFPSNLKDKILAHTAGSVPASVFKNITKHYGVLWPIQSIRKELSPGAEIPIAWEASDEIAEPVLFEAAAAITNQAQRATADQRLAMHVAAVMVNNFSNYFYTRAELFCQEKHLDFSLLLPLIKETANRLDFSSAREVQTGPAVRNDESTIQKHLQQLKHDPDLQELYATVTEHIRNFYKDSENL